LFYLVFAIVALAVRPGGNGLIFDDAAEAIDDME